MLTYSPPPVQQYEAPPPPDLSPPSYHPPLCKGPQLPPPPPQERSELLRSPSTPVSATPLPQTVQDNRDQAVHKYQKVNMVPKAAQHVTVSQKLEMTSRFCTG